MGYILRRVQYANGLIADKDGRSPFDYTAYFEEGNTSDKRVYSSVAEAIDDGCKFMTGDYEGVQVYVIVEGASADMVRKAWEAPRNEEEAQDIMVRFITKSKDKMDSIQWMKKNLPFVNSVYGINFNIVSYDEIMDGEFGRL